jgi:preprotein translocase subunit SecG
MPVTPFYLLFVLSALLLIVVILIQEGRGGGLGDAFGGAGQQTFGVGTRGITRFTSWVGVAFLASAVAITWIEKENSKGLIGTTVDIPTFQNDSSAPPAGAPTTPPAGQ